MMRQRQRVKYGAAGMTLVELLVTLGIVTLIAALVLPTVRSLLTSRKASQAGLLVRNYLEAARARAIASGKEVAVVLERVSSRVYDENGDGIIDLSEVRSAIASDTDLASNYTVYNACIRLSLAEEQRPSDAQSFGMSATVTETVIPPQIPRTFATVEKLSATGNYIRVLIRGDLQSSPLLDNIFPPRVPPTDFFPTSEPLQVSFGGPKIDVIGYQRLTTDLQPVDEKEFGITKYTLLLPSSRSIENNELINPPNDLAFRSLGLPNFHKRPRYSSQQPLSMPRGTCIDLSLSGFGTNRTVASLNNVAPARGDYRLRFSSDWISPITSGPSGPLPKASDLRPVILVFGKNGALTRVYGNHHMPVSVGQPESSHKAIDVVDDVYLHIGKIDQVTVRFEPSEFPYAGNLKDANSQIIRISGSDGSVSVFQAGAIRLLEDTSTLDSQGNPVPPELDPSWIGSPLTRVSNLGPLVELVRRRAVGSTQTTQ